MSIAEKVLYVIAALLAVSGVVIVAFKDSFTDGVTEVQPDIITLTLKEADGVVLENVRSHLVLGIASTLIVVALMCIGIRVIRKILKSMKAGRPFDTSVADSLRKLS